jgi:hypothetical protein
VDTQAFERLAEVFLIVNIVVNMLWPPRYRVSSDGAEALEWRQNSDTTPRSERF